MDQRGLPRRRGIQRCLHSPDVVALRLHLGDALKGFLREIKLLRRRFRGRADVLRPSLLGILVPSSSAAKTPGFVERDFDTDLSVQIQYDGDGICTPVTAFGLLRAIPTLFAIRSFFRNQEHIRPRSSWRVDST